MLKQIVTGVSAKYLTLFRKITLLHSLVFRKYASSSVRCVTLGRVFCLSRRALFFSCTEYLRMLIQLVKLLDEDLHEHLKQEVSIWLALSFTAATTTGNRLLTVWVPLDKLSNASRDSVSSLSASMGTSRFHFERVARCMQGSTFLQTDHAYILWLSGYVCC